MANYFVASFFLLILVVGYVQPVRRRGVRPANYEVREELARQGIVDEAESLVCAPAAPAIEEPPAPADPYDIEPDERAKRLATQAITRWATMSRRHPH